MTELILAADVDVAASLPGWITGASSFTGAGVLIWYLWYRTAKRDPEIERAQHEHMTAVIAKFDERLNQMAEDHREDAKGCREDNKLIWAQSHADNLLLAQTINKQTETFANVLAEFRRLAAIKDKEEQDRVA